MTGSSFDWKPIRSIETLDKVKKKRNHIKPLRGLDQKNNTTELENYEKYNDQYYRGLYSDKASALNDPDTFTASSDYKLLARNLKTQIKDRDKSYESVDQQYGPTVNNANKR